MRSVQRPPCMKQLDRLIFEQGGDCFFCRQPLSKSDASIEHLVAVANGGPNHEDNCVACCKAVNALLGSKSLKNKIQVILNQRGEFRCPASAGSAQQAGDHVAAVKAVAKTAVSAKGSQNKVASSTPAPAVKAPAAKSSVVKAQPPLTATPAGEPKPAPARALVLTQRKLKAKASAQATVAAAAAAKALIASAASAKVAPATAPARRAFRTCPTCKSDTVVAVGKEDFRCQACGGAFRY